MDRSRIIAFILAIALIIGLTGCSAQDPLREDMYFGDQINHSYFSGGRLNMAGTARVLNGLWIDAGGIKAPGAKPATEVAHGVLETPAWQFANQALVANQESVSFNMRIPYLMDRTESPFISVGWSTTTVDPGDSSENVTWQLEYLWTSPDESTAAVAQGTVNVTSTASTVPEGMVFSLLAGIEIPSDTDICLHCRLTRLSADPSDTVSDEIELHGICLQFISNKLGE